MADTLVIHEDPSTRRSLVHHLRRPDARLFEADDVVQARPLRERMSGGVIVAAVPAGESAAGLVQRIRPEWPAAEIVVMIQPRDVGETADAMKSGAVACVVFASPADTAKVVQAVKAASVRRIDEPPNRRYEAALADSLDPATRQVFDRADRAAQVNCTVLITGESGTGKEILARRIHSRSARARAKFVPVNCGSLPDSLIETELFGYKKGAFTGAVTDAKGLLEEAEHGVLFLDEIGETPLAMQVRLLRFLDSGEVRAVGGTSFRHVDVRIIAATNRFLEDEVHARRFREDLYFRLSVVPLELPPLRERKVDIPNLVHHYLHRVAAGFSVQPPDLSDGALGLLMNYDWPGNIRELQNALEHALVQCTGEMITADALPPAIHRGTGVGSRTAARRDDEALDELVSALRRHKGSHANTAAALGISRTTLWRRLKQLDGTRDLPLDSEHATVQASLEREPT
jgi:DNA-binding NtrC family response regulator